MEDTLGSLVRRLRASRRLSQQQVAREAGVGRAALARWEGDTRLPHRADLDALLHALLATTEEHQQAHELLGVARLTTTRQPKPAPQSPSSKARKSASPLANGQDLLRALRLRRGLSQSEAAARVGVTERTLRRWEGGEIWPSAAQLHNLCSTLGAETEVLLALSSVASTTSTSSPSFLETLKSSHVTPAGLSHWAWSAYFDNISWHWLELTELHLFLLAGLAEPHASRSEAGRCALAHVYSFLAAHFSTNERWSEAARYANRALDLWPSIKEPDVVLVQAAFAAARAAVYRSSRPAPHKGIEVLRHWLDVALSPGQRAWLLSDLAKYTALSGDPQSGASLAQQAREVTIPGGNDYDIAYRALDHAQTLIWGGQYAQAQESIESAAIMLPGKSLLLEVEAWLNQGDHARAQARLETAWTTIESFEWPHDEVTSRPRLQAQARKLELRLVQ